MSNVNGMGEVGSEWVIAVSVARKIPGRVREEWEYDR